MIGAWAVCTQEFFKKFLEYFQPGLTQPFPSYYSLDLLKVNKCSEVHTVFIIYCALNSKSVPDLLVRVVLLSTNDAFEPLGAAFPSLFRRSCNKSWLLSQKGERSTCPEIRYFAMVRYSTKLYNPSTIKICLCSGIQKSK